MKSNDKKIQEVIKKLQESNAKKQYKKDHFFEEELGIQELK